MHIPISFGKIDNSIHHQLHTYNFAKITKDFFQMAFIDIPAEFFYVQNKRLSYRRRLPWGRRSSLRLGRGRKRRRSTSPSWFTRTFASLRRRTTATALGTAGGR